MKKSFELLVPEPPNFILIKMPAGLKQDGFKTSDGININTLTEQEAIEYGEAMKQQFINHWRNKTKKS